MTLPVSRTTEEALRQALARLIDGCPTRTDGRLTVANLAREAGMSRATANRATAIVAACRDAIAAAGGVAAEGSSDRSLAKALPGAPSGEPPPHLPNIIHSTVLRWASEPSEQDIGTIRAAFERIASCWEALEFSVDASEVRAVYEDVPFMHIAHDAAQVFWAPPSAKLESQSLQRDK